jgi:hypothetical protein
LKIWQGDAGGKSDPDWAKPPEAEMYRLTLTVQSILCFYARQQLGVEWSVEWGLSCLSMPEVL